MRVLEVARQFYPKVGGIESCVLNLSRGLVARGHVIEVLTLARDLRSGHSLEAVPSIDSIPIHRLPHFGSRRYPIAPGWLQFIEDFDVIHIHAIDFFIDSAAFARRLGLHRKPIVVTTHGGIFHTAAWLPLKNLYWNNVLRRSLGEAAKVVAVSDRDAALFRSIVPAQKLVTIPNGIESVFTQAGSGSPRHAGRHTQVARVRGRVVSVGRVTSSKAIDKIIELIATAAREFPEIELVVAGPHENGTAEILRRQGTDLGLGSRVRFLGALPLDELASLVASAHLFISAAQHEGFGITTVEALSAGVPVIVTRTGVHEQIVRHGANGWFWSGRPDAEAAAILREALLLPDARLDEMKIAARASAAPFDWKLTTDRYEKVLESAYRESIG